MPVMISENQFSKPVTFSSSTYVSGTPNVLLRIRKKYKAL